MVFDVIVHEFRKISKAHTFKIEATSQQEATDKGVEAAKDRLDGTKIGDSLSYIVQSADEATSVQRDFKETPYGWCPHCGSPGETRERRPDGNDECSNGHVYPSVSALKEKP